MFFFLAFYPFTKIVGKSKSQHVLCVSSIHQCKSISLPSSSDIFGSLSCSSPIEEWDLSLKKKPHCSSEFANPVFFFFHTFPQSMKKITSERCKERYFFSVSGQLSGMGVWIIAVRKCQNVTIVDESIDELRLHNKESFTSLTGRSPNSTS